MIPKKILYCSDFSDNSAPSGQCAVAYAKVFGSALIILHVVDSWAGYPNYVENMPVNVMEVVRSLEAFAKKELEALVEKTDLPGERVKAITTVGVPSDEIVQTAAKESADLIVMGTHGWTGFKHILLGSVAEKVLRAADCPVLVVKAPPTGGKRRSDKSR